VILAGIGDEGGKNDGVFVCGFSRK
jgi:hypothetical protein